MVVLLFACLAGALSSDQCVTMDRDINWKQIGNKIVYHDDELFPNNNSWHFINYATKSSPATL